MAAMLTSDSPIRSSGLLMPIRVRRWSIVPLAVILLGGGLLLCILPTTATAGFDDGHRAYDRGDYDEALRHFRPLAEEGDRDAQYWLGWMYSHGEGVEKNDTLAVVWYRRAAGQGEPASQNNLGWMYSHGIGVAQDYDEALRWYRLSANQGDPDAQYNLGWMYSKGNGVPQDVSEAVKWYRMAAAQGHRKAKSRLLELGEEIDEGVDPSLVFLLFLVGGALATILALVFVSRQRTALAQQRRQAELFKVNVARERRQRGESENPPGCAGCGALLVILAAVGLLVANGLDVVLLSREWIWGLLLLIALATGYLAVFESGSSSWSEGIKSAIRRSPLITVSNLTFGALGVGFAIFVGIAILWWMGSALAGVSASTIIIILLLVLIVQNTFRE